MAVHTLRIDCDAAAGAVELRSAATWARGPGRVLAFNARSEAPGEARLVIDDRLVSIERPAGADGRLELVLQVATAEDRLTLRITGSGNGTVTVTSAADTRGSGVGAGAGAGAGAAAESDVVLYLERQSAPEGASGDPALA